MSLLWFFCVLCISAAWSLRSAPLYALEDAELHFENFIQKYGKQYANEIEKQARFEIFKVNLEEVNQLNEGQDDAVFGMTLFMDLTLEEFLKQYTGFGLNSTDPRNACPYASEEEIEDVEVPDAFDWREQNVVTSIKQQQQCGACYAFSSMGNIESQYAIKYGQLLDLSEQQIVDCDTTNSACGGGFMSNVFRYLIQAGGAEGENDYPFYGAPTGVCQFDASKAIVRLADCRSYFLTSQERLKQLLYTTGPISIAIQATSLNKYHGGTISDQKCDVGDVNHAVLLVGYGTDPAGVPIWIVKNSWGTEWGDQGYFSMVRGDNAHSCGMMNDAMSSSILA